eukprot:5846396-Amphidinium_carterae.1
MEADVGLQLEFRDPDLVRHHVVRLLYGAVRLGVLRGRLLHDDGHIPHLAHDILLKRANRWLAITLPQN